MVYVVLVYALARVSYGDEDLLHVFVVVGINRDAAAGRCVLLSIIKQDYKDLIYTVRVAEYRRKSVESAVNAEVYAGILHDGSKSRMNTVEQFVDIKRIHLECDRSRLKLGKLKHVVDETRQS